MVPSETKAAHRDKSEPRETCGYCDAEGPLFDHPDTRKDVRVCADCRLQLYYEGNDR